MKRGFTLAELMGVLVVLALIGMIAIPSVTKTIKENKKNLCKIGFTNIIEETKGWAGDNIQRLPGQNESTEVYFSDLVKYGYSEDKLVDPKTKEEFGDKWKVVITKSNNRFEYKIYNDSEYIDPEQYCN